MAEPASKVQEIIIEGCVSGLSALIGVLVGAWLALRAYRTNQWWDAKLKVYLEGMNLLEELFSTCAAVSAMPGVKKISEKEYESACLDAVLGFQNARGKIISYLGRGRFNLSDKAYSMVLELAAETALISNEDALGTRTEKLLAIVNRFRRSFAEEARHDLRIAPWHQRFQRSAKCIWLAIKAMASQAFEKANRWLLIIWFGQEEGEKRFAQRLVERSLPLTAQNP